MWLTRRQRGSGISLPARKTTWVDGGSGISWRFNGLLDYGRFHSYIDMFGDEVVLPFNLITTILNEGPTGG